jgi:hypothetical protein
MTIGKKIILSLVANRYYYVTNQTDEQIKLQLKELTKSVGLFGDYRYNLTGVFSKHTFRLHRRAGLWIKSEPVIIYGKIIKKENNLIDLDVEIKPTFEFLLFVMLFPIIIVIEKLSTGKTDLFATLFCFCFSIILWINAYITVAYYKDEFEKAFDLVPEIDPISSRIRL